MMRYSILLSILTLWFYTGCSSKAAPEVKQIIYEKPTPAKEERFHPVMVKVAMSTKENQSYNRMALDTDEKKTWFKDLMYRLWDRQITRKAFIEEGLIKYPNHRYEFSFVANGFQRF